MWSSSSPARSLRESSAAAARKSSMSSPSSSLKSSRSSLSGSLPALISRATTAQTLAATSTLKRCSRGTSGRSSPTRYSATDSSSSGALGESCPTSGDLLRFASGSRRDQLEHVPFGLADSAAQRGELMAAAHAAQVVMRLARADHRPLHVSERLPVADSRSIDRVTASGLVGGDELIQLTDARDRPVVV